MIFVTRLESPLGQLTLAGREDALTGLWLPEQKHFGAGLTGSEKRKDDLPLFVTAKNCLQRYFAGEHPDTGRIPLDPAGSEFQRRVWKILLTVPYGETVTYGEIARRLGTPGAARAVGGAVSRNPIAILIPCHRVRAAEGPGGYAGGMEQKRRLLTLEGALYGMEGR